MGKVTNDDFMKRMTDIFMVGMKLKKKMIERKLTKAWTHCPFCDSGRINAVLVGKKNHMHMSCNQCDVRMME